ncbi:hypothetical protein [Bacillus paranthracis]|uniref:hypothetical protein n=1 Tax=Bacillus paranthracis TaxID=2026186 RepID=UPI002D7897A1|nr:hypothetical protein [Bacillus paranthracis]
MTSKMATKKIGKSMMERIPEYKMTIMNRIIESDKLSKLLFYNTADALFKDNLTDEQKQDLIYTHVFPFRFVPDPIEQQETFLAIGTNSFRRHQEGFTVFDDYQSGEVIFYFFTHKDLMRTTHGVRQDLMLGELERIFDGVTGLGMGELKLRNASELWIHNNKFGGYSVAFTITDFK